MAAAVGWTGAQWRCLDQLWAEESGWDPHKSNYQGSGAYGIPQALPGNKMASALTPAEKDTLTDDDPSNDVRWQDSATVQIRWGIRYISGPTYHTPCGALAHKHARGWY